MSVSPKKNQNIK